MIDSTSGETIAQMNIKLPAKMKQAIKASVSMAEVPLKQVAQDALLFYFDRADDKTMARRARVMNAFNKIAKETVSDSNPIKPTEGTLGHLCW
jgi:hypothetical protein